MTTRAIDPTFLALPLDRLADAALAIAKQRGATYADFRVERLRSHIIVARDRELQTSVESETVGFSVRVVCKGAWGFAAGIDLTTDAVAAVARRAVEVAESLAPLNTEPVTLADEPVYTRHVRLELRDRSVCRGRRREDQFPARAQRSRARVEADRSRHLARDARPRAEVPRVARRIAHHAAARAGERRSHGRPHRQIHRRVRDDGKRGAAGRPRLGVLHHGLRLARRTPTRFRRCSSRRCRRRRSRPAATTSSIDPTNLWLTIHESIGHSTELDRVLGYEANYAGTSFATLDKLNTLQFGAPMMHVTGDRQVEHGLSTVGYDDEGVAAQTWDIVRDGVLVGYQLDRQMAHKQGFGRSNGCAFADQAGHVPLQRMPNVSLSAEPEDHHAGRSARRAWTNGLYIVGDKSWSIDMQRYNFQFTGQKFFHVRGGKIVGQVKDVAYQSRTTDFWNSMEAVGGPSTYVLGGAFNCGKGQPGQIAPVTHGCPAALFRQVNILNTAQEGH